jgi:4-hydroxyphenylpyruvate dioxygenase
MACKHGITGIEVFYEDLEYVARAMPGGLTPNNQIAAAHVIRRICGEHNIEIVCLQPFMHYEGLKDRVRHAERIEEMRLWLRIARALGTDLISIPSAFLSKDEIDGDVELIVRDLREVANMGMQEQPVVRFAYESLAWGTYADTWEKSWEVVKRVDRPNFGLVLDTFNIAARIYADPTAPSGRAADADTAVGESMARLVKTVDTEKLFYVQVVDAERLASPLVEGHEFFVEGQPARMNWSRNCRLFYGEQEMGAYLPILKISRAIFEGLGYDGWVSVELFHRCLADESPDMPEILARRAAVSWRKWVKDCRLEDKVDQTATKQVGGMVHSARLDLHL